MRYTAVFLLILSTILPGCMTLQCGYPVDDRHPYARTFDADPETTLRAVHCALFQLYRIPVDEDKFPENRSYYARLYSDQKIRYWVAITTSDQLNFFIRPRSDTQTDVIILYERRKSVFPFYDRDYCRYVNDDYVDKVFAAISDSLGKK
jgi:hypothetical protein